jgi:16S rRNA G527 N7-methylase RsmG
MKEPGFETLQRAALERLATHLTLLFVWNRRFNLTAISDPDEAVRRHVMESLEALPFLDVKPGDHLGDLGAGNGYPGLALLCAIEQLEGTLFEARDARAAFLRAAIRETGLTGRVVVEQSRLAGPEAIPDSITLVTLRGLPRPTDWIEGALLRPRVRVVLAWLAAASAKTIADVLRERAREASVHPLRSHPAGALLVARRG